MAMVLNMEKKRAAQTIKKMPRDKCELIAALKIADINDVATALRLMLHGKYDNFVTDDTPSRQARQRAVRQRNERRVG